MQTHIEELLEDKGALVHTIELNTTVWDAVQIMNDCRIGSLVVVDDSRPVGMFTERDILTRVIAACREPATTRVFEVMTQDLVSISGHDTVEDAMRRVTLTRCRHLPVIEDGCLAGLISIGDLTRWMIREQKHEIANLMDYITAR